MASGARTARGTLLKASDMAGSPVFTTIAEVRNISGPTTTVNTEDVTNMDSGAYMEFVPTLIDSGELTFEINYKSDATQDLLRSDLQAVTFRNYQLVLPTLVTETWAFSAIVTGFQLAASQDSVMRASVTLKISGAVTVTP
jgi:predicted secreted protein